MTYGDGSTKLGSYTYECDSLGRLIRSNEYDGSGNAVQRTEHKYDAYNRLKSQAWTVGSTAYSESYTYDDPNAATGKTSGDGSLLQMTTASGATIDFSYDNLKRLNQETVKSGSTTVMTTAYAYRTVSGNRSSAQIEYRNVRNSAGTLLEGKKYTYDALGNITMISQSTGSYYPLVAYEYDAQNQLVKETYYNGNGTGSSNVTATYTYTYDTAGNLLSVKKDGTTVQTYTYGDTAWKDLMTAFNGKAITYDASGNPLTYGSWDFAWQNGRQLSTAEKTEGMTDTTLSYAYDASGIRTSKTYTVETNTNQYTVTFVADGTTVKTMTVDGGYILQDSDYPSVPAKTGYNGSWQQYTAEIHTDVTIQATYTIKTYTVTFKRGTLTIASKTFSHGYVLNDSDYPTAPTGYEWERYTQPICSNVVIYANEVTGNEEEYTVTFSANGVLVKTMTVVDGYVLKNSDYPAVPPRMGYTGSWNKYTGAIHESITITARYIKNGSVAMSVGDETELLMSDISAEEDLLPVQDSGEADAPAAQAGQTLVSTQTVRHDYVTQNGKVVRETVTTDGTVTAVMDFIYDESGSPFALRHSTNGSSFTTYYYVLNLQGDVVKLVNAGGTAYATYTYNAWGEVLTATGSMASINPLRYRGYYYDSETGFYYLQSRYYDPANHRFINADIYTSTDSSNAVACNMFAYCGNNPIAYSDETGEFFGLAVCIGIGICALISGTEAYVSAKSSGASTGEALVQGGIGFLAGGATAAVAAIPGIGVPTAAIVSGSIGLASSTASEATHYLFNKDDPDYEFNLAESCANVALGAASNALAGSISNEINLLPDSAAAQTFIGSVFSTSSTATYFGVKKLIAELF